MVGILIIALILIITFIVTYFLTEDKKDKESIKNFSIKVALWIGQHWFQLAILILFITLIYFLNSGLRDISSELHSLGFDIRDI